MAMQEVIRQLEDLALRCEEMEAKEEDIEALEEVVEILKGEPLTNDYKGILRMLIKEADIK